MKYLIFDFDGVIGDTWEATILAHGKHGKYMSREDAIIEMNKYFNNKPNHTRTHSKTGERNRRSVA